MWCLPILLVLPPLQGCFSPLDDIFGEIYMSFRTVLKNVYHESAGNDTIKTFQALKCQFNSPMTSKTVATVLKRSKSKIIAFISMIYQILLHLIVFTEHFVCVRACVCMCVYLCSNCGCLLLSPLCVTSVSVCVACCSVY